jgi:nitrate reductase beta subunit
MLIVIIPWLIIGGHVTGPKDPNIQKIEEDIKFQFDETFMMYLPRFPIQYPSFLQK